VFGYNIILLSVFSLSDELFPFLLQPRKLIQKLLLLVIQNFSFLSLFKNMRWVFYFAIKACNKKAAPSIRWLREVGWKFPANSWHGSSSFFVVTENKKGRTIQRGGCLQSSAPFWGVLVRAGSTVTVTPWEGLSCHLFVNTALIFSS
jgi:hypothetical protein